MYKIIKKLKTIEYGDRFSVTGYKIRFPDNSMTTFYIRQSSPYAIILPFLDKQTILMIRQYRLGANKISLEFPMGSVKGKKPLEIARQELEEETGYSAKEIKLLTSFYLSPGWSTQIGYIYCANGLVSGISKPEPYEFIELVPTKVDKIETMIKNGEIFDASAILAYSYYKITFGKSA